MDSIEWVVSAGRSWQVQHTELQPDHVRLSITFDYGSADEPTAAFGTLHLLGGLLRAELQRPVEVGPGEVAVPDVDVFVAATTTTLAVSGRRRAVLAAWDHLGELFRAPRLSLPAHPLDAVVRFWPEDVAWHVGACTESLSRMRARGVRDVAAAERLLAHLAPSACRVRHVLGTNDPYLVGAGWAGTPDYGIAPTVPPREHDRRAALVRCSDDTVILSVAAPPSLAALGGSHAVGTRVFDVLRELGLRHGLSVQATHLRDLSVFTYAVDKPLDPQELRRVLDQVLQPALALSDSVVERAVGGIHDGEVAMLDRDLRLRGRDLAAPASGRDLDAEWAALAASGGLDAGAGAPSGVYPRSGPRREQVDVSARPSAAVVREAYASMLAGVHVPQTPPTLSLAPVHGLLASSSPQTPSDVSVGLVGFDPSSPELRHPHMAHMSEETLVVLWYEWTRDERGKWKAGEVMLRRWVDLTRLRLGLSDDDGYVTLVDDRLQYVTFPWQKLVAHPEAAALLERRGTREIPWFSRGE